MALEIRGMAPLLEVFDMPTSLGFYRDKLGFKVTGDSGQGDESGWVMLELGEETIMLNTAYDDGERPEKTGSGPRRCASRHMHLFRMSRRRRCVRAYEGERDPMRTAGRRSVWNEAALRPRSG